MSERVFSALTNMKTKYRSRLDVESDLRVCLPHIAPRIEQSKASPSITLTNKLYSYFN